MRKMAFLLAFVGLLIPSVLLAEDDASLDFPHHYFQVTVGDPFMNSLFRGDCDYFAGRQDIDYCLFEPNVYIRMENYLPAFSVSYHYAPLHWLHIGAEMYYCGHYKQLRDVITNKMEGVSGTTQLCVLPTIRFQYLDRKYVGLYSGVALGLYMDMRTNTNLYRIDGERLSMDCLPAFQLTALGVRFGDKVYGITELGIGHKGFCVVGIGTRF